jgi:hypothetical protein
VPLSAVSKDTTAAWLDKAVTGAQTGGEQEWSGFESSDGRSDTQPLHVEKIPGQVLGKTVPSRKQKNSTKLSTQRTGKAKDIVNGGLLRGNTFEALQEATDEEADGERAHFRCGGTWIADKGSFCVGRVEPIFAYTFLSGSIPLFYTHADTERCYSRYIEWARCHWQGFDWLWKDFSIWYTNIRALS